MKPQPEAGTPAQTITTYAPNDQEWAEQFHAALVLADATEEQCIQELLDQRETIASSGQGAEELIGNGWLFGKQRARQIKTPEQLAQEALPVDNFHTLVLGFGLVIGAMAIGFGIWIAFKYGWMAQSWLYWQLACFIAGGSVAFIGTGFVQLRMAARFKASWRLALTTLPVAGLVVTFIFLVTEEEKIIPIPNFLVPVLGLMLAVGVFFLPEFGKEKAEASVSDAPYRAPEAWFAQAQRILRGRYGFTKREADIALADAKGDWLSARQSGQAIDVIAELGAPNEFAIQVAPNNTAAMARRWALKNCVLLAVFGFYLYGQIEPMLSEGFSWWSATCAILSLLLITYYLSRFLPSKRTAHIREKQLALQQSADAVAERQDNA